jgi:hypothetical protein
VVLPPRSPATDTHLDQDTPATEISRPVKPKPADKPGPDVQKAIKPMDFQKLLDLIEALKT